jgi:hypothetical protein
VCAADGSSDHSSTMFANALQDRYALKKVNNSASLGVGVLGSVSMPIGSTDDSMVKVASETVASDKFYDRYFSLVESFMPVQAKKAMPAEQPKGDLGVPEAAPAISAVPAAAPVPLPATAPLVQPVPEATQTRPEAEALPEQETSQPLAPPVQPAPIEIIPVPDTTEAASEATPQAPVDEIPASVP